MNKKIVIPVSLVAAIVVIGLAVWFLLPRSQYEQLPGSKDISDNLVHLMELERLLEQKSEQMEEPKLCNCCNSVLIGGQCPICQGGCDNSAEYKMVHIPDALSKETRIGAVDDISNVKDDGSSSGGGNGGGNDTGGDGKY